MKASVIFRFTNRSARRAENLKTILRFVTQRSYLECIVVAMEHDIDLKGIKVRKHFSDSPFESSRANNIGASIANTNIYFFQDADIFFDLGCYDRIIDAFQNGGYESARVGEQCVNLGSMHLNMGIVKMTTMASNPPNTCLRDAPGACIALTRDAFVKVGGFCELFKVYGWEDCYMRYKVQRLTKQKNLGTRTMHLPHEVNYQMSKQPVNSGLYGEILGDKFDQCVQRDQADLFRKYPKFMGTCK